MAAIIQDTVSYTVLEQSGMYLSWWNRVLFLRKFYALFNSDVRGEDVGSGKVCSKWKSISLLALFRIAGSGQQWKGD